MNKDGETVVILHMVLHKATDSIHCRVWKDDKFPEFRVFRNCGRSAKRNSTDGVVNVPAVMHWLFFTIKNWLSPSGSFVKPDCMLSENCVVWTASWVLNPINVVSSPLPSFLLYFLFSVTSVLKRVSLCHFSNVYFSQCRKHLWINGNTTYSFCCIKKNSLFVLSTVETSSLNSHFLLIFQKQNKFLFAIFCQTL